MKIELLWFEGCPNHEPAEKLLAEVMRDHGIEDEVVKVEVPDYEAAQQTRFVGSPTIRINGTDIEPGFQDPGEYSLRCRVFQTSKGFTGRPQREWIEDALERAEQQVR